MDAKLNRSATASAWAWPTSQTGENPGFHVFPSQVVPRVRDQIIQAPTAGDSSSKRKISTTDLGDAVFDVFQGLLQTLILQSVIIEHRVFLRIFGE
jgi:hypothetical protein